MTGVKWQSKNGLEKITIVFQYLVGVLLLYFSLNTARRGGMLLSLNRCPECLFQL